MSAPSPPSCDVKYRVSDALKHRHPYSSTPATAPHTPLPKVVDGFRDAGLQVLLSQAADPSLDPLGRVVALKHLHARSALPEAKLQLLHCDIVPLLSRLLLAGQSTTAADSAAPALAPLLPQGEALAAQLLRSLAVLPQGCACVVTEGGLAALLERIADRTNVEERVAARAAGLAAVQQLVASWQGRSWSLGVPVSDAEAGGMRLADRPPPSSTPAEREALAQRMCDVLVEAVARDTSTPTLLLPAVSALAAVVAAPQGAQMALIAGATRALTAALHECAVLLLADPCPPEAELLTSHTATAAWNVAMDAAGKAEATEVPIVPALARVLGALLRRPGLYRAKANVAGALCGLLLHVPLKPAVLTPLNDAVDATTLAAPDAIMRDGATLLARLMLLLQSANVAWMELQDQRRNAPASAALDIGLLEALQGCLKNTVQAVRLSAELPAARAVLKDALLRGLDGVDDAAEFRGMAPLALPVGLRRQLFYQTDFQAEFRVPPV